MSGLDRNEHEAAGRAALASLKRADTAPMAAWLRGHLFGHVLPFWDPMRDTESGGLFTCVADDGQVVSGDKWLWSQWRAVWVYARLFNTLDRHEKWRDRALKIAQFCVRHGWLESEQGWALLLDRSGTVKRGYESVYVDAFAVYGLVELAAATRDSTWLDLARKTADAAMARISRMGAQLPHFPYPIPAGAKPHGVPMIWSLKLAGLAAATGESRYVETCRAMMTEVWRDFYSATADRIHETVSSTADAFLGPTAEVTVPGHVIEGLWFQRLIAAQLGLESQGAAETWRVIARHYDLGWDEAQGGGLLLATGADGHPAPAAGWAFGETKLWWPQTEALFASLLGWHETGEQGWLGRYEQLWELCWAHYVDWENGEWRQKLNRDLSPLTGTIALPVKDPFHLPRSLMLQIELLENKTPPRVATV